MFEQPFSEVILLKESALNYCGLANRTQRFLPWAVFLLWRKLLLGWGRSLKHFILKPPRCCLLVTSGGKYGFSFELLKKASNSLSATAFSIFDFGRPPREPRTKRFAFHSAFLTKFTKSSTFKAISYCCWLKSGSSFFLDRFRRNFPFFLCVIRGK